MFHLFIFNLFFFTLSSAQAQIIASDIDTLLERAVGQSLRVKAQKFRVEQQQSLSQASSAWSNPNAIIESQRGRDNTDSPIDKYQFSILQPLTSPWKTNIKKKIADSELNIEKHHLEDEVLSIKINTLRMIFNYNIAVEKTKKVDTHLKRIEILKIYLKSRKFISGQKQAEAFIVENKIKVLRKQLDDLKILTEDLWLKLNQLLNLPDKRSLKSYWVDQTIQLQKSTYAQKALSYNHDIELAGFEVEKSKHEYAYEKNQKLPDLALTGGLSKGKNNNPEDNFTVGLNMQIPLFNMNINKARASSSALHAAQTRRDFIVQEVQREFESTFLNYELSRQQIQDFPLISLIKLENNMSKLTENFKKGQIDLMTFVEADVTHDNLIDETLHIQMNYIHALSQMSFLVGEMIPLKGVIHEIAL